MRKIFILAIISFVFSSSCQKGERSMLTLPAIFNNNMVLQRNTKAPFWGNAQSGKTVIVRASWGTENSVVVNEKGMWNLKLETPDAGGPFEVKIISDKDTINYHNVLIGEVWVCSGQSNMEMPLQGWPPQDLIEGSEEAIINKWLESLTKIDMSQIIGDNRWKNLEFDDSEYFTLEMDDSQWNTMELPCLWESTETGEFDGTIWFRKTVTIDKVEGDYKLELGPIDDMDATYFNGKKIEGYEGAGFWGKNRIFIIPRELVKQGKNIIVVRVIDTGGGGGIWGTPEQMKIYPIENFELITSIDGEWRYRQIAEFQMYG